jgi:putative GTP pyrophosphokinase
MNISLHKKHSDLVELYNQKLDALDLFYKHVINIFQGRQFASTVHSIRHRLKDIDHLVEKIERKNIEDGKRSPEEKLGPITQENLFKRITDMAGVRVLHLHFSQFQQIHETIMSKVNEEEFLLFEDPKAYSWDPESIEYFKRLNLHTHQKDSYYTSIHYVLKPNNRNPVTCEVQVRTLLEEVWGEIDHTMNYPNPTSDDHCKEQIRILARLVGAGSHLADSIMKRYGVPV